MLYGISGLAGYPVSGLTPPVGYLESSGYRIDILYPVGHLPALRSVYPVSGLTSIRPSTNLANLISGLTLV